MTEEHADHDDYWENLVTGYWAWSLGEHEEEQAYLELKDGGWCGFKTKEHEPIATFGEDYCHWKVDPFSQQLRLSLADHVQGDFVNSYTDGAWMKNMTDDGKHDEHEYWQSMVRGYWAWSLGEHEEEKAYLVLGDDEKCEFKNTQHEPINEFGEDYCHWKVDPFS